MKKIVGCLLLLIALISCSSNSTLTSSNRKDISNNTSSSESTKEKRVMLSPYITNGANTKLSYVNSGYTFAADGNLKYWYTLRNVDSVDYTDLYVYSYVNLGGKIKTDVRSIGLFKEKLSVNESMTFYYYILKNDIKDCDDINISINDTSGFSLPAQFSPKGYISDYSLNLSHDGKSLYGYTISATFIVCAIYGYCINTTLYCRADVVDVNGNLMTFSILSGKTEGEKLFDGQAVVLTGEINLPKSTANQYSHLVFTI